MTFQNFKKGYPQTLIENLLSDIKFTERENALLKHNKEKREVLPFVTQNQPPVSTWKEVLMENGILYKTNRYFAKFKKKTTYHFL